jgi:transketolase
MALTEQQLDRLAIDTIRTLAIDAVQQANSGHPGAPMGMAPMAYVLWTRFLRHAPTHPDWPDRDRFVLSAGHASMMLYALLHLTGYQVPMADLRRFRQWGSITPGHPEWGITPGVEATTGPLGQGFGSGVGMAIAERRLAAEFVREGHPVVDHRVYGIVSDGDLQEGVASEAASLAGHLRLGRLVYLWDHNGIQLDGPTRMATSEDILARFAAYGWHTSSVEDGNDLAAIEGAVAAAVADPRPSLVAVRTHIGYGSPNRQDSQKAHGAPLGVDEVRATKEAYGWDPDRSFYVPDEVAGYMSRAILFGEELVGAWERRMDAYRTAHPDLARELERRLDGSLPAGWRDALPTFAAGDGMGTRNASQQTINALAAPVPELFGGAADLAESNLTDVKDGGDFTAESAGRNIRFGVREHAMGAIANGIAYHGGFVPYAGTFLTFSDYMRGSVRVAALSGVHVIYVWTHDSVGLGEDGPTHQPVEQVAALRAMPGLWVLRPADANETAAAWAVAVARHDGPVALALTRQKVPTLATTAERAAAGVARGGYIVLDEPPVPSGGGGGSVGAGAGGAAVAALPDLVFVATGSEVHVAVSAAQALAADGIRARVVSLPSWELFERQDAAYREAVLPAAARRRVTVEAGVTFGWDRWAGDEGAIVGLDRFGASAPGPEVMTRFGFTAERLAEIGRAVVRDGLRGRVPLPPGGDPDAPTRHG